MMKKRLITLLLSLCSCIPASLASTNITTPLVSGHWTLAGSPYYIYNDIKVDTTASLSIDPGVTVIFKGQYRLAVNGILYAVGTAGQQINFQVEDTTGFSTDLVSDSGGWHGIQFFPYEGVATDTSAFQYCNITHTKLDSIDYMAAIPLYSLCVVRDLKILNCNLDNNRINSQSVAIPFIYSDPGRAVEIGGCNFFNNYGWNSSVISTIGTDLYIHDCKFYQNHSQRCLMFIANGHLSFYNNEAYENILENTSSGDAIISMLCNATLKGNKIHDNICEEDGAICSGGGFVNIISNLIYNNQHTNGACGITDGGGGMNLAANGMSHDSTFFNVRDNVIANNYSPFHGGAIKIYRASATVTNNQIVNNMSPGGGAIVINDADTSDYIIRNNLFYGNALDTSASSALSTPVIYANLIYSHLEYDHNWTQTSTASELYVAGTGYILTGDSTTNVVGSVPGMIAPSSRQGVIASAGSANFSLLSTSACINKGDATGIITDTFDCAGNTRIKGGHIDIGAYEYDPALTTPNGPIAEKTIQVYPDPAHDKVNITVPDLNGTVTILDLSGKQLFKQYVVNSVISFDLHSVPPGVYFVVWDDGRFSRTTREMIVE